jgi:hypothetical protein
MREEDRAGVTIAWPGVGHASGTVGHSLSVGEPGRSWLKAGVGSDLAITGIFPLLTTERKQMRSLPALRWSGRTLS